MRYIVFENVDTVEKYALLLVSILRHRAITGICWCGEKRIAIVKKDTPDMPMVRHSVKHFLDTYPQCRATEVIYDSKGKRLDYYL